MTAVRGLGEWTADWFLARHLAVPAPGPRATSGWSRRLALLFRRGQGVDRGRARLRRAVRAVPEPERSLPLDGVPRGAGRMNIRDATGDDRERLRELYREF